MTTHLLPITSFMLGSNIKLKYQNDPEVNNNSISPKNTLTY